MRAYDLLRPPIGRVPFLAAASSVLKTAWLVAREPVIRIRSQPAAALFRASGGSVVWRTCAAASSESVIVTPVNPSRLRRMPLMIDGDQAAARLSSAGDGGGQHHHRVEVLPSATCSSQCPRPAAGRWR
jgi:hypothetical protein